MKTESVDELFQRLAKEDKEFQSLVKKAEEELEKELSKSLLEHKKGK